MQLDDEMKALVKCTKLIDKLDDEAKLRVMKYLVERFGRGLQKAYAEQIQNQQYPEEKGIQQLRTNIPEKESDFVEVEAQNIEYPSMNDIVIKDLPKNEPEWVLIYGFYLSEFGKKPFTREGILNQYNESNRYTDTRRKNLSGSISKGVKEDWYKSLNTKEYIILDGGINYAKEILKGNSTGYTRKQPKRKQTKKQD